MITSQLRIKQQEVLLSPGTAADGAGVGRGSSPLTVIVSTLGSEKYWPKASFLVTNLLTLTRASGSKELARSCIATSCPCVTAVGASSQKQKANHATRLHPSRCTRLKRAFHMTQGKVPTEANQAE